MVYDIINVNNHQLFNDNGKFVKFRFYYMRKGEILSKSLCYEKSSCDEERDMYIGWDRDQGEVSEYSESYTLVCCREYYVTKKSTNVVHNIE